MGNVTVEPGDLPKPRALTHSPQGHKIRLRGSTWDPNTEVNPQTRLRRPVPSLPMKLPTSPQACPQDGAALLGGVLGLSSG